MPLASAAFRYPVRFSATSYVLRVNANVGGSSNLTFPASGSLSPTTDYFFSGDGSSTDLIELIRACIDSHGSLSGTTASLDSSHKLVITVSGNTFSILWSNAATTLDPEIFGFITGSDTQVINPVTSPNIPMGLVYLDLADGTARPVSIDSRPRQGVVGGISRSISGLTRGSRYALPSKDRTLTVGLMHESIALDEYTLSDAPFATFESMHVRAMSLGYPIHFLPDDTDDSTYSVLYLAPPLSDKLKRDDQYRLRWSWTADFIAASEAQSYSSSYSYQFDGSGDYIDFSDVSEFDSATAVTWSWWERHSNWNGSGHVWSKSTNIGPSRLFEFNTTTTGRSEFRIYASAAGNPRIGTTPSSTFANDTWYHLCVVYDGSLSGDARIALYVNGSVVSLTMTGVGSIPASLFNTSANMQIGAVDGSTNIRAGYLDEMACWVGTAASSSQASELYNSGTPTDLDNSSLGSPTFWYRGDGDSGGTATDHGSAAVNGTYQGNVVLSTEVPP